MARPKDELTPQQKAAILLHVYGEENNKHILFQVAEGVQRYEKLTENSRKQTVSIWWNSSKIKDAVINAKFWLKQHDEELKQRILKELEETETSENSTKKAKTKTVNFLNLEEFLQYANEQANKIPDEKERRAWVEMIGKYMNFKETDEETEQIRAYLPQICEVCECYRRCKSCKLDKCPIQIL